jgi:hypothetical protein
VFVALRASPGAGPVFDAPGLDVDGVGIPVVVGVVDVGAVAGVDAADVGLLVGLLDAAVVGALVLDDGWCVG